MTLQLRICNLVYENTSVGLTQFSYLEEHIVCLLKQSVFMCGPGLKLKMLWLVSLKWSWQRHFR